MNVHLLHAAATVCVALGALAGCTTDLSAARPGNPPTPRPTSTVGQWNVGLIVHGFNASGSANFTYADGMTRTMRFTGNESELKDTSMVLVGQTVSITVIVEESSGTPSQASCAITEADFDAEGSIQVVGNGGSKGERFTCTWTNDGTLETPEPERSGAGTSVTARPSPLPTGDARDGRSLAKYLCESQRSAGWRLAAR